MSLFTVGCFLMIVILCRQYDRWIHLTPHRIVKQCVTTIPTNMNKTKSKAARQHVAKIPRSYADALPPRARVRMSYSLTESISGHATANFLGAVIDYQVNSIFAPGGGAYAHQPYMRDTFFAQYNKYRVNACLVRIHTGIAPAGNQSYLVSQVAPPNVTVTSAGVQLGYVLERFDGRNRPLMTPLSTAESKLHSLNIDMAHACGVPPRTYQTDDTYAAAMGNDPSNKVHLLVNLACSSLSNYSTTIVTFLEFDVDLFERLIVSTS